MDQMQKGHNTTTLIDIRRCIDSTPILSFERFQCRDPMNKYDLYNTSFHVDVGRWRMAQEVYGEMEWILSRVEYLHYLCYRANGDALRQFVQYLHMHVREHADVILNHHGIYEHYEGTPLHTLSFWCNDQSLIQYMVDNGCQRSVILKDAYDNYPGTESTGSIYIPTFFIGCEVDQWHFKYQSAPIRCCNDFHEAWSYLNMVRMHIMDDEYVCMREWLHMNYSNKWMKKHCPEYAEKMYTL